MQNINIDKGWMPDFIPFGMPEGGLVECKNLLPLDRHYAPANNKAVYSTNAVTGTPLAAMEFYDTNGQNYVFVGTSTKLYRLEINKSLTDITKLSTTYITGDNIWSFLQYGTWIVATNFQDNIQVLKGFTTANFIDLGGSPPKAKYCLFKNGHLILANLNESGTLSPKKVLWSALENIENFAESLTTGASSQDFPDADGDITGMAGIGNSFGIFHKDSITIGWYSGAPFTFNFAVNKFKNIGALPNSVISIGDTAFFLNEKDIYAITQGGVESIGHGIKNTFRNSLNFSALHKIRTAHDPQNGLIFWLYQISSSTTNPDRILCYNYREKKWSHIDIPAYTIFLMHTGAVSWDSIDALYPLGIESIPYSGDNSIWLSNASIIGCLDTADNRVATLSGTVLTGEIETGEAGSEDAIVLVRAIRPLIQNAIDAVNVQIGSRFDENDAVTYSSAAAVNSYGEANIMQTGRYHRIKMQTGLHSGIASIKIDAKAVGKR